MDTELLQVLAFGALGLLRNSNNNTASNGSNSGAASESGSTGVPANPPSDEYTDIDTDTPPKDEKPAEMPSNPNYYRLWDTSKPYDPFYDYSDNWSSDRLGYVDGQFAVPASGSGHLIRMRMLTDSFSVSRVRSKFNFINLKDSFDFYHFSFYVEIFNPFDVDIHIHSLILDELNENGAIQYRGIPMFPYMEDVASSYHTKALDGRAMAKKDEILTYLLYNGYPSFNKWVQSGNPITASIMSIDSRLSSITVKGGSPAIIKIILNTKNGLGFFDWLSLKYKLDAVFDNEKLFSFGFRYKMESSPEEYLSYINIKGGNSPSIVPAKWWEYQYVGTDAGNFKL